VAPEAKAALAARKPLSHNAVRSQRDRGRIALSDLLHIANQLIGGLVAHLNFE
jgi:hypothetical protein